MKPDKEETHDQAGHRARGHLQPGAITADFSEQEAAIVEATRHEVGLRVTTGIAENQCWPFSLGLNLYPEICHSPPAAPAGRVVRLPAPGEPAAGSAQNDLYEMSHS